MTLEEIRRFDYEKLDPGIRRTVKWLHLNGYNTTDSGDGVSKDGMECAMSVPNVVVRSSPSHLARDADRIKRLLEKRKIHVGPVGRARVCIQASYDPSDNSAVIVLLGVDDEAMLA